MRRNVAFLGTAVVVVSAVVNVAHTASHAGQHLISLPGWQLAYIAIVIYAAPVVAASVLWTRYRFAGAWLLAASMAGSFAFGLLPIYTGEVADRMVKLALGAPAGRVPDVGGPEVRLIGDAVRTYLEVTRMRKKFLEFPLPGKTARAMRGGALTCPENTYGRIRWEEFLRKETVGNPGLRR